jgi:hypothetical protein
VWSPRTRKLKMDLPGHVDEVFSVAWSPVGKDRMLPNTTLRPDVVTCSSRVRQDEEEEEEVGAGAERLHGWSNHSRRLVHHRRPRRQVARCHLRQV